MTGEGAVGMNCLMRALLVASLLLSFAACSKTDPLVPLPPSASAPDQEPAPIPPRLEGPIGDLLSAYESARARLAADDLAGAQPFAAAMAAASRVAAEHAVTARPTFDSVTAGADRMVAAKDIGEMRLAYGEVSKGVIALLVADPELRTGRFLMLCPMAKGYQKWVQTSDKLNNPYWGKEMLECGEQLKAWSI